MSCTHVTLCKNCLSLKKEFFKELTDYGKKLSVAYKICDPPVCKRGFNVGVVFYSNEYQKVVRGHVSTNCTVGINREPIEDFVDMMVISKKWASDGLARYYDGFRNKMVGEAMSGEFAQDILK